MEITSEQVVKLIETVDAGLVKGLGKPIPGNMCVEAAVCYALGLPHSDDPLCVSPVLRKLKIDINDQDWASFAARAKGLRKLAVLQLGTKNVLDEVVFAQRLSLAVVNKILPPMLNKAKLVDAAAACSAAKNLKSAYAAGYDATNAANAASYAAGYAANAAANAANAAANAASYAAHAAGYAAGYAATNAANAAGYAAAAAAANAAGYAANADDVRFLFTKIVSDILVDMNVPGVQWLPLLQE